jgi:hypothetical protein
MTKTVTVLVDQTKKEDMYKLLSTIAAYDLENLSFGDKKHLLNQVVESTYDIMHEQGKAFDLAIAQLDENNRVSVVLDLEVSNLIDKGIKLQRSIMKSYM